MLCSLLCYFQCTASHASITQDCSNMAEVMQQHSPHAMPARQPSLGQPCRSEDVHAAQPLDRNASCNGTSLLSSPQVDRLSDVSPLPTFDIAPMLAMPDQDLSEKAQQLCQAVAACLRDTGCLIVRDPRVKTEDNTVFLDMMERYFAQSTAAKLKDTRPKLHFQVCTTPADHPGQGIAPLTRPSLPLNCTMFMSLLVDGLNHQASFPECLSLSFHYVAANRLEPLQRVLKPPSVQ